MMELLNNMNLFETLIFWVICFLSGAGISSFIIEIRHLFKKKRHFIVVFTAKVGPGITRTEGQGTFTMEKGEYPSRDKLQNKLLKEVPDLSEVVIINIIELNEKDYKYWISS